jgi:hypothetical protein
MLSKTELREKLDDEFDTSLVLDVLDDLDSVRHVLADNEETYAPCEVRQQLHELHSKLFHFIQHGSGDPAELFKDADDIETTLSDITESIEKIQKVLSMVTDIVSQGVE